MFPTKIPQKTLWVAAPTFALQDGSAKSSCHHSDTSSFGIFKHDLCISSLVARLVCGWLVVKRNPAEKNRYWGRGVHPTNLGENTTTFEVWEKSIPINGLINWHPIGLYPHISGVISPYWKLFFGCFWAHFAGASPDFWTINTMGHGFWVKDGASLFLETLGLVREILLISLGFVYGGFLLILPWYITMKTTSWGICLSSFSKHRTCKSKDFRCCIQVGWKMNGWSDASKQTDWPT